MKKHIGLLGALAAAAITIVGVPAMAQATEVCVEEVTTVEQTWNVEEYIETAPAVPAVPAVPATPHEGLLEVTGDWDSDTISTGWTGTIADLAGGLDIVADPIQYVGLHIQTPNGSLVYEEEPSYGGKLWSTTSAPGVPSGMGYASFGFVDEFVAAGYGEIAVTDVIVLYTHPAASSTIVSSVTIGGDVFTFAPGNPGSPEIPGTPAVFGWVANGETGQGEDVPEDTDAVRYVVTGEVDVVREIEVECAVEPVPTPTPTPGAVVVPVATETPATPTATQSDLLAETGFDMAPFAWMAVAGLLAGLALLGGVTLAAKRQHQR